MVLILYDLDLFRPGRSYLGHRGRGRVEYIVSAQVLPARVFWPAEGYHQRYLEKGGQSAEKECEVPVRCYG